MKKFERDEIAKRVVHLYKNKFSRNLKLTLNHFKVEEKWEKTIRNIIKRYENEGQIITSNSPGQKPRKANVNLKKKIQKIIENDPNIPSRIAARRLKVFQSYYTKIKVKKLKIKSYVKLEAPGYSEEQERRAKTNCRKIYRNILLQNTEKFLLIDDEVYIPMDPRHVPGRKFYHGKNTPIECKIKSKTKFFKKSLIWQCLDGHGNMSEPYVSRETMNGKKAQY